MIYLRNVRREGNTLKAEYSAEDNNVFFEISLEGTDMSTFKGECLEGYKIHRGHAKWFLHDIATGVHDIPEKEGYLMWY